MRIVALIVGLVISAVTFVHSFLANFASATLEVGGEVFRDTEAVTEGESLSAGAGYGVTAAILGTIAAGLALKFPRASCILFTIAAVFAIGGGAGTTFDDLMAWGILFAICAVFSFFGQRSERRWPLSLFLSGSPAIVAASTASNLQRFCAQCGHNIAGYRFCNQCGQQVGS